MTQLDLDQLRQYLPKYLSPEGEAKLFEELGSFPENIDKRLYSELIKKEQNLICQGDGIQNLLIVRLPKPETKKGFAMVVSNTCDTNPDNKKIIDTNLCYCPIINLEKWKQSLEKRKVSEDSLTEHLRVLRNQLITQIFFLPKGSSLPDESFISFDQIISCPTSEVPEDFQKHRIFSLSQYGHYLFLLKLSIHFSRLNEGFVRVGDDG